MTRGSLSGGSGIAGDTRHPGGGRPQRALRFAFNAGLPLNDSHDTMAILDSFRLDGQIALVTGAARGLGWEMAQALAEARARGLLDGPTNQAARAGGAGL